MDRVYQFRRPLVVVLHLILIILSNYLAFWLRFDSVIPESAWLLFVQMLPWLLVTRGLTFVPFRLYEGLWRYTGIWDLTSIVCAVTASSMAFYAMVHFGFGLIGYPRSVFIIDPILLIVFLGGIRLTRRIYREFGHLEREKRILIYGAGDAGEMIVRDIRNNPFYEYEAIGFIDDDPIKVGQRIHGVKVLGTREVLGNIMESRKPDAVLVAMPTTEPAAIRKLVKALEPYKVSIKTLPNLRDLLGGKVAVSQIRNLSIEDLLERAPIGLSSEPITGLLTGKRVMVTGAGGSIGSELCRQIVRFDPSLLVLYERYENSLYAIANELEAGDVLCLPVIGDVTDPKRLISVMAEYRPEIIFHAAAHKHVPLMEMNPCEAVKNNIKGTRLVAETARLYKAEKFILISTDKAVRPTSVMGVSKRIAESIILGMNDQPHTIFSSVRFGNVLGSNGSVVPRFIEQIKAGGPVTVTHPDMRRYFMLIPEAVQLVLHAAGLATGGENFVLEMGEQIKIVDVARNLIRLSGFVPDEDIPIVFTGPRPGEKLYEELVDKDETVEPLPVQKILRVKTASLPDPVFLAEKVAELELLAAEGKSERVIEVLSQTAPSYMPAINNVEFPAPDRPAGHERAPQIIVRDISHANTSSIQAS